MNPCHSDILHIIPFILLITLHTTPPPPASATHETHRRNLHQPLNSGDSTPAPELNFFPKPPNTPPPYNQIPPPSVALPSATHPPTKPMKKLAIAISVGIVTLGMLSALTFFIYRHRSNSSPDSEKLVVATTSSHPFQDDPILPPSNILYMDPPCNHHISSPYNKLDQFRHGRYRPSPELHPMDPLPTTILPPSRSDMSLSDEDFQDTTFYTPSILSGTEDGFHTPAFHPKAISVPHSKRTSPKSRFSGTSPVETKRSISPEKSQYSRVPPPPPPPLFSNRAKFSAPPPPPNMKTLRSITSRKIPPAPPPTAAETTLLSNQNMRDSDRTGSSEEKSHNSSEDGEGGSRPKLKPLHWDKVRATSDHVTVWDHMKSSSFQLNEEMIETLFGCNSTNPGQNEAQKKIVKHEKRVLDPKKSQNIAILLRALNVTRDEVAQALLDGNPQGLGPELLETLVKMAPTKEEEIKLGDYNGDISKLGSAEQFLKAVLDIPFAFKRVEGMLYRANFDAEVKYLLKSYKTLQAASEELKKSRLFLKLLEAVLRTGNRMNVGTNRGDATSFKLDTLLKLVDIKGADGKTTLLHFVVQEIVRSEGVSPNPLNGDEFKKQGLQVVSGLSSELGDVKKAAGMDSDVLSSYVSKLESGLAKLRLVLQYEVSNMQGKFFESMKLFLGKAEEDIAKVKAEKKNALSRVMEVTQYFHGDKAKNDSHSLKVFVIVRDFLNILDGVCKEVGRMQDGGALVGCSRSFRISTNASFPVLNRLNVTQDSSSDEE